MTSLGVSQQQLAELAIVSTAATDVGIYGLLASPIPCLFLVSLHCGPVVDFTTLHPFDFDRNLFNFLVLCPLGVVM